MTSSHGIRCTAPTIFKITAVFWLCTFLQLQTYCDNNFEFLRLSTLYKNGFNFRTKLVLLYVLAVQWWNNLKLNPGNRWLLGNTHMINTISVDETWTTHLIDERITARALLQMYEIRFTTSTSDTYETDGVIIIFHQNWSNYQVHQVILLLHTIGASHSFWNLEPFGDHDLFGLRF